MAEPSDDSVIQPGTVVGKYRIERLHDRGGMGCVYKARDTVLGRPVAIKTLHAKNVSDRILLARFQRECAIAANVSDPHIVEIHDGFIHDGVPYLVMPFLQGETLQQAIKARGRLPVTEAVSIALHIAGGLVACHHEGIVHRDLKPQNIFLVKTLGDQPHPRILDFGVAKLSTADGSPSGSDLTAENQVLGTPNYMAPEQALGTARDSGPAADQYSLAAILYRCLSGERPYPNEAYRNPFALGEAFSNQRPRPLIDVIETIPSALNHAIMRALSPSPLDRFASIREFGAALYPFASDDAQGHWRSGYTHQNGIEPSKGRVSRRLSEGHSGTAETVTADMAQAARRMNVDSIHEIRPTQASASMAATVPGPQKTAPAAHVTADTRPDSSPASTANVDETIRESEWKRIVVAKESVQTTGDDTPDSAQPSASPSNTTDRIEPPRPRSGPKKMPALAAAAAVVLGLGFWGIGRFIAPVSGSDGSSGGSTAKGIVLPEPAAQTSAPEPPKPEPPAPPSVATTPVPVPNEAPAAPAVQAQPITPPAPVVPAIEHAAVNPPPEKVTETRAPNTTRSRSRDKDSVKSSTSRPNPETAPSARAPTKQVPVQYFKDGTPFLK